ncbi:hypothetical protein N9Z25_08190 [Luminiphilus sp.]|nr:hypothetical protein [Luminiphilus sp.]
MAMIEPVRVLGSLILGGCFYVFLGVSLLVAPICANLVGYGFSNPYLRQEQQAYYVKGPMRSIWQADAGCAVSHEDLGYTARLGECKFKNAEFDTKLRYTEAGWAIPPPRSGSKERVVVLGDSQTMAWGVNHDQSFAYLLRNLGYTVSNFAISSYATEQQLQSVVRRPEFSEADTLIIQYCENDMDKNKRYLRDYLAEELALFSAQQTPAPLSDLQKLTNAANRFFDVFDLGAMVMAPVRFIATMQNGHALEPYSLEKTAKHKAHLLNVLGRFAEIKNKSIIVFYSNGYGKKFTEWDMEQNNIHLVDMGLRRRHYHRIDDHLNIEGHEYIASKLNTVLTELRLVH